MDNDALIEALVREVERRRLSDREAGDEIGISHEAIRKYRAGLSRRVYAETRRKIEKWLGRKEVVESPSYAQGAGDAIGEVEAMLADLRRRLGLSPAGEVEGKGPARVHAARRARQKPDGGKKQTG